FEGTRDRNARGDTRVTRRHTGARPAPDGGQGIEAVRLRVLAVDDHECGGAVVEARRVPRSDPAALLEDGGERRQLLERCRASRVLVGVEEANLDLDGHDLVREAPGVDG